MARNRNVIEKLKNKAEMMLADNRLSEAGSLYTQLCQLDSGNVQFWVELGIIQRRLKKFSNAEEVCRKAVSIQQGYAPAHLALGGALQQQGRFDEALSCYREAIRLTPDFVEAHYFLANALRQAGFLEEATDAYRRLLEVNPDHFTGLNNLGTHLRNLGEVDEAISLLRHALQLQPESVETMTNLGDACVARSLYEEAIEILQRAVSIEPEFANAQRALANALHHAGRLKEALVCYERAGELVPGWQEVMLGQARILEQLGEYRKSYDILRPLIKVGHGDALPVFFDISKHIGQREWALRELERFLDAHPDMRTEAAAGIHFQLGKHYDEAGEYDTAFRHFEQANAMSRMHFDRDAQIRLVDEITATYDKVFIQTMRRADNKSDIPVFIVGMPRSGTSLVEQILASHPDIFGAGELPHLSRIARHFSNELPGIGYPRLAKYVTQRSLDSAAGHYLHELQGLCSRAARVIDKMPYNLVYIGLIFQLFPRARVIQCIRHPLDTCLSCFFSDFGTVGHGFSYNLKSAGEFYIQYHRLMQHWISVFPDSLLQVNYAELVHEQEKISRHMVEFCGLGWNDRCLDFHKTKRFVFTLSYDQVRQPIYTHSLQRWKHYESHLQALRTQLETAGISCE